MQQGDLIDVPGLGERKVRKARKSGPCYGWAKKANHDINPGDLYVDTELKGGPNPFAMCRSCLDCIHE